MRRPIKIGETVIASITSRVNIWETHVRLPPLAFLELVLATDYAAVFGSRRIFISNYYERRRLDNEKPRGVNLLKAYCAKRVLSFLSFQSPLLRKFLAPTPPCFSDEKSSFFLVSGMESDSFWNFMSPSSLVALLNSPLLLLLRLSFQLESWTPFSRASSLVSF